MWLKESALTSFTLVTSGIQIIDSVTCDQPSFWFLEYVVNLLSF
jgi:hypothetical protein